MKQRSVQLLLLSGIVFSMIACEKNNADMRVNTFKGPEVQIGNGKARSFLVLDKDGVPQEFGIEMTAGALEGLPEAGHNEHGAYLLPVHQKVKDLTPFDHIVSNWSPAGHPPANVFTVPHFDFHFYMMTEAARMAIPPYSPATAAQFDNYPPAGYMPAGYVPFPGGEGAMGKHWGDPTTFMPFTRTMILGTFDGHVTFVEPMITLAYLRATSAVSTPYAQPQFFEHTGKYYPTVYNIRTDDGTGKKYITLSNFVLR